MGKLAAGSRKANHSGFNKVRNKRMTTTSAGPCTNHMHTASRSGEITTPEPQHSKFFRSDALPNAKQNTGEGGGYKQYSKKIFCSFYS